MISELAFESWNKALSEAHRRNIPTRFALRDIAVKCVVLNVSFQSRLQPQKAIGHVGETVELRQTSFTSPTGCGTFAFEYAGVSGSRRSGKFVWLVSTISSLAFLLGSASIRHA